MNSRFPFAMVLIIATIALVACAGAKTTDPGSVGRANAAAAIVPRGEVRSGGTLTTPIEILPPQFNRFQADASSYTASLWRWYNPVMMNFDRSGRWSFNTDYLTGLDVEKSHGNTQVTYTVRTEAKFNDGTPIDWRAFEATWKVNKGDPQYQTSSTGGYDRIVSVTRGVDDKQAVVTFDGTWSWWQGLFSEIAHPKLVDPENFNSGYLESPRAEWGAGPYTVDTFDMENQTLTFKRNPLWWGDRGKLDARIFRGMEDTAALNAFKNGEIDAVQTTTREANAQVGTSADTERRESLATGHTVFGLNSRAPRLRDRRVREAVVLAIDRQQILDVVFQGTSHTEELPGSLTLYPYQDGYRDNFSEVVPGPDPARAQTLLDRAGWKVGKDGVRAKDGERLSLILPNFSDSATIKARAQVIRSQMAEVGIEVVVEQRPSAELADTWVEREFDLLILGMQASDPYGVAYFSQVWSTTGVANVGATGSKQLDNEITDMGTLPGQREQIAIANRLEVKGFSEYGQIPLYTGLHAVTVRKGLVNMFDQVGAVSPGTQFFVGKPQDVGWQDG